MNYYYKVNKASLNKMFVGGKMGKQIHQAGILYFIIYEIVTRNYQLKKNVTAIMWIAHLYNNYDEHVCSF